MGTLKIAKVAHEVTVCHLRNAQPALFDTYVEEGPKKQH